MKILRYGDDENTWEPLKNLAHLDVFKEYIAQQKSVGSSRRKNATPKKIVKFKNYASKSSEALSSTHAAATKADDDEQSDKDPPSEEDEDDVHNGTAEMDETGKGMQTFTFLFTINEPNKLVLSGPTIAHFVKNSRCRYRIEIAHCFMKWNTALAQYGSNSLCRCE